MKLPEIKNQVLVSFLAVITGILAGVLNGFLGSGGGIILIFAMTLLFPALDVKEKFATAVASILPMSAVSAVFYYRKGQMVFDDAARFLIPAVFGGLLGAFIMRKISPAFLKTVFAALMIYAGIRFVL